MWNRLSSTDGQAALFPVESVPWIVTRTWTAIDYSQHRRIVETIERAVRERVAIQERSPQKHGVKSKSRSGGATLAGPSKMFTDHLCPVCEKALRSAGIFSWDVSPETGEIASVRLTTDPVALAVCPQGHQSVLIILDGAHSLLFERALQRLVAGSTRDAVMDAYTAFEMYLAHVPARARYDREIGSSPRALRAEMNSATKTAERSMAAALTAASLAGGGPPPRIDTKRTTELRNNATHAGHYPKDAEAENLCLEVERIILSLEALLSVQKCVNPDPYWTKAISEEIVDSIDRQGLAGLPRVHSSMGTVLATNQSPNTSSGRAKEAIASYRRDILDDEVSWRVW